MSIRTGGAVARTSRDPVLTWEENSGALDNYSGSVDTYVALLCQAIALSLFILLLSYTSVASKPNFD